MLNNESIVTIKLPFRVLCSTRFILGITWENNLANLDAMGAYNVIDSEIKRVVEENGGYEPPN